MPRPLPPPPTINTVNGVRTLAITVEESRALRQQRLKARFRDRGGVFVPSTDNPLTKVLLARGINGESPGRTGKEKNIKESGRGDVSAGIFKQTKKNRSESQKSTGGGEEISSSANPPSKRRTTPANSRKPGPRDDEDEEPNMKHRGGASKVQPQKADADEGSKQTAPSRPRSKGKVQPPTTVADRPARLIPRRAGGTATKLALDTDDGSQLEGTPNEMEPSTRKRSRSRGSVDVESGTSEDERGRSRPATTHRRRKGASGRNSSKSVQSGNEDEKKPTLKSSQYKLGSSSTSHSQHGKVGGQDLDPFLRPSSRAGFRRDNDDDADDEPRRSKKLPSLIEPQLDITPPVPASSTKGRTKGKSKTGKSSQSTRLKGSSKEGHDVDDDILPRPLEREKKRLSIILEEDVVPVSPASKENEVERIPSVPKKSMRGGFIPLYEDDDGEDEPEGKAIVKPRLVPKAVSTRKQIVNVATVPSSVEGSKTRIKRRKVAVGAYPGRSSQQLRDETVNDDDEDPPARQGASRNSRKQASGTRTKETPRLREGNSPETAEVIALTKTPRTKKRDRQLDEMDKDELVVPPPRKRRKSKDGGDTRADLSTKEAGDKSSRKRTSTVLGEKPPTGRKKSVAAATAHRQGKKVKAEEIPAKPSNGIKEKHKAYFPERPMNGSTALHKQPIPPCKSIPIPVRACSHTEYDSEPDPLDLLA